MARLRDVAVLALSSLMVISVAPSAGSAQLQISPTIGMYLPHGRPLLEIPGGNPVAASLHSKKPVGGPVFTTRMGGWLTEHFGLEATLAYSPALVAVRSATGAVEDLGAKLVLGSLRTNYRLTSEDTRRLGFQLGSGIGFVNRSGDAWNDTPSRPALAFILSAGARAKFHARGRTAFRVELEDYISWAQFEVGPGARTRGKSYHDVVWSLGLVIPVTPRPPQR